MAHADGRRVWVTVLRLQGARTSRKDRTKAERILQNLQDGE